MRKDVKPLSRRDDLVVQDLNGEVLIYDLKEHKAFCLNETSALVWEACNGSKNVTEISRVIGEKLNAPASEDLVWLAIDQLKKEKLLADEHKLNSPFKGLSRREVIKKVGLGTMIALPIITGLVAPKAIHAGSRVCSSDCTCTQDVGKGNSCSFTATATCTAGCTCTQKDNGNARGTCA